MTYRITTCVHGLLIRFHHLKSLPLTLTNRILFRKDGSTSIIYGLNLGFKIDHIALRQVGKSSFSSKHLAIYEANPPQSEVDMTTADSRRNVPYIWPVLSIDR